MRIRLLATAVTLLTAAVSSNPARADLIALWNFHDAVANATGGANELTVDRTAPGVTTTKSSAGYNRIDNLVVSGTPQAVPEPASLVMLAVGLAAIVGYGFRRRLQAAA